MLLSKEDFRKLVLDNANEIKVVASHHDADGISSAVLFKKVVDYPELEFPEEFGFSPDADIMLDMTPVEGFSGLLIDHHPMSLELANNSKWKGFIDIYAPTSYWVYQIFKDLIPERETWKAVVGIVGDGRTELIPTEILRKFPELLIETGKVYQNYGKTRVYHLPLYRLISSGINSLARIGKVMMAYNILKEAETPVELLRDSDILDAQEKVDKEVQKCLVGNRVYKFGIVSLIVFNSKFNLQGRIASQLSSELQTTVMAVNMETHKISLRGDLAVFIGERLPELQLGGHAGYMGGYVPANYSVFDLITLLSSRFGNSVVLDLDELGDRND